MARTRLLHASWAVDDRLAECEPLARLLFYHLHNVVDREGRIEDRPKRIGAQALPFDERAEIDDLLEQLIKRGFIVRYVVDSISYLHIAETYWKLQHPHVKEVRSMIPSPAQIGAEHRSGQGRASTGIGTGSPVSRCGDCDDPVAGDVASDVMDSRSISETGTVSERARKADELTSIAVRMFDEEIVSSGRPNYELVEGLRECAGRKGLRQIREAEALRAIGAAIQQRRLPRRAT